MIITRQTQSKIRNLLRVVFASGAMVFGFIAVFFMKGATTSDGSGAKIGIGPFTNLNLFVNNVAHADTPAPPDPGGGGGSGGK